MDVIESITKLFADKGQEAYFGEAVTQTEHALQTAHLAEVSNGGNEVIAAALLHDVGHLLHGLPEDVAGQGIDGRHEEGGADWLARYFRPAVAGTVRLHVAAKRYLCAVDPLYDAGLSPASRVSLRLQGGPFTQNEVRRFEQEPFWQDAVALRRWDDQAKVPGLSVAGLEHYRSCLEAALIKREDG
jgi:[1-hydroxy-2-(trimethylamino)ethyl]phosphonate dioxygenase